MIINQTVGMCGFVKLVAYNPVTGKRRVLADWFQNTILTTGREYIGTNGGWAGDGSWCHIGTGGTPPLPTDSGLESWFDSIDDNPVPETDGSQTTTPPYYGWNRTTYRFPVGTFPGGTNISEVGIGWSGTDGDLISRTLVVNPSGVPTVAVPQADEALDVLYELRYYPPLGDVQDTLDLDGAEYTLTTRAANVNLGFQYNAIGSSMGVVAGSNNFAAYDGEIGTVLQGPTGASDDLGGTPVNLAYAPFTYYLDMQATTDANGWVLGSGIRSIVCTSTAGQFQTRFGATVGDTTVPKIAGQSMSITWRISWAGWLFDGAWSHSADAAGEPATAQWNTDVGETTLRVNWTDGDSGNRKEELKVQDDTIFHIQQDDDPTKWSEYTVSSYVEGTAATSYTIDASVDGYGGRPDVGKICTIRAMTP